MSAANRLIDYLPFYDADTEEMKELCRILQLWITDCWRINEFILGESFVQSAESIGLERLESILGLNGFGLDTAQRRQNIIFRLMGDLPYTMSTLYDRLSVLFGSHFELEYGDEEYTLNIRIGVKSTGQFEIMKAMLERILPANIGIRAEILRNRHCSFRKAIHGEMKACTHYEIRNDLDLAFLTKE